MLAKTPLRDQMAAWLDTKNPAEEYDWRNCQRCACAQFAESIGCYDEWLMAIRGGGPEPRLREWLKLNHVARGADADYGEDWTFGDMRKRLLEYA